MPIMSFKRANKNCKVFYKVAAVSLFLSSLHVTDIVVLSHDSLSFAMSFSHLKVSFVRVLYLTIFASFMTKAMLTAAKEPSQVLILGPTLRQQAKSLPEPIHELTKECGF